VPFLAAFARGINVFATQSLMLPAEYIAQTQSDLFEEWTSQDVAAVLANQGKNVSAWQDQHMRIDLLTAMPLVEYGPEPLSLL
jgi:hypothetical protein